MKILSYLPILFLIACSATLKKTRRVFDVHIHGSDSIAGQLNLLEGANVYKAAISSSWQLQNDYRGKSKIDFLYGLMLPCPNGKVPYSLQPCFENGQDWPSPEWVERQIKDKKIDFLGEVLTEYYGISPSDTLLFPYYSLAEKYSIPVGIHTGAAGPGHGSPFFNIEMGNPVLLETALTRFPELKVWIMHGGDQYYKEAIAVMNRHKQAYADISVISNPAIVTPEKFKAIIKAFVDAGLEDRIKFGSDNGNIEKVIASVDSMNFLTMRQKDKIFYQNAERFFTINRKK